MPPAKVSNREHSHAFAPPAPGPQSPLTLFELQQDGASIMATQTEGSLMNFAQMLSAPGLGSSGRCARWVGTGARCQFRKA